MVEQAAFKATCRVAPKGDDADNGSGEPLKVASSAWFSPALGRSTGSVLAGEL
jgi:hypothetical protein